MAIQAQMHDGTILEFEDGTPDDVIDRTVQQHLAEQKHEATAEMPWYAKAAKVGAMALRNATKQAEDVQQMAFGREFKHGRISDMIAEKAGLDNYEPATEAMSNPNLSVWERASYAPRAMAEDALGIAFDAGTFGAGHAVRTLPGNVEAIKRADGTEGQELTPQQLARVAALTAVDSGLSRYGLGNAFSAPVKGVGAKALAGVAKKVAQAGAAGAVENMGQTLAANALVSGEAPSPEDMAVSGLVGAGGNAAIRGARAVPEAIGAVKYRGLADLPPDSLARVMQRVQKAGTGNDAESAMALKSARGQIDADYSGAMAEPGMQQRLADLKTDNDFNDLTGLNIREVKARLDAGEHIPYDTISKLREHLGPSIESELLARSLEDANTLNKVQTYGNLKDGEFSGGIMGSDFGRDTLTPYHGALGVVDKLVTGGGVAGHFSPIGHITGPAAAAWMAGRYGANALAKGVDALMGSNNPLGQIASRIEGQGQAPIPYASYLSRQNEAQRAKEVSRAVLAARAQGLAEKLSEAQSVPHAPSPAAATIAQTVGANPTTPVANIERTSGAASMRGAASAPSVAPAAPMDLEMAARMTNGGPTAPLTPAELPMQPEVPLADPERPLVAPATLVGSVEAAPADVAKRLAQAALLSKKFGDTNTEIKIDPAQVRDMDAYAQGIQNKVLRREAFISRAKDLVPPEQHQALDSLLMENWSQRGHGLETARRAYFETVDGLSVPKATKDALKNMFTARGTGLNQKKSWGD